MFGLSLNRGIFVIINTMKKSRQNTLRKKRQAKLTNRNFLQIATDSTEGFFLDLFEKLGLASFVDWYIKKTEAMRYLVFGALCTVVNVLVFVLFNALGLPTLASNTIAWIVAVIFAYTTNKYCVFNAKTTGHKDFIREFGSFIVARLATLGVETIMMWVTIDLLHWNAIFMKVAANIVVIILNFVFSKLFIFKNSKEAEIIDSLDD